MASFLIRSVETLEELLDGVDGRVLPGVGVVPVAVEVLDPDSIEIFWCEFCLGK